MSKYETQFSEVHDEETGKTTVAITVYDSETDTYKSASREYNTSWAHYERTEAIDAAREEAWNK